MCVPKPNGKSGLVIDYRLLNERIQANSFPLPNNQESIQQLRGKKFFSKVDLRDGFHNVNEISLRKII